MAVVRLILTGISVLVTRCAGAEQQEEHTHTLSRQMDNQEAMIEKHYSKLTATMAAERPV